MQKYNTRLCKKFLKKVLSIYVFVRELKEYIKRNYLLNTYIFHKFPFIFPFIFPFLIRKTLAEWIFNYI